MGETFKVDAEFESRLFGVEVDVFTDEELERSLIQSGGPLDPLRLAQFPEGRKQVTVLMDGHRRYRMCQRLGLPCQASPPLKFPSRQAALEWMDEWQMCRRALTRNQASLVRARMLAARRRQNREQSEGKVKGLAAAEVAAATGVDKRTVYRDQRFERALDELHPDLHRRAVDEFSQADVIALATMEPEEQVACVKEFDSGEYRSLRSAIFGEQSVEGVVGAPLTEEKATVQAAARDKSALARSKLIKTLEAAQRAADELHDEQPNEKALKSVQEDLRRALVKAKEWK